jgi:hypothetical protein
MPVTDPFSYYGRFDSMDFDCSMCKYYSPPPQWPDMNKVSRCNYHNIPMDFQLGDNCYKLGSWFCKKFEPINGSSKWRALAEFETIRNKLEETTIYSGANGDFLFEHKV